MKCNDNNRTYITELMRGLNNYSMDRVRVQKCRLFIHNLRNSIRTSVAPGPLNQNYLLCYDKGPTESQSLGEVPAFCFSPGSYTHECEPTIAFRVAKRLR